MKLINHKQRSKAWLEWRATKICASDSGIILGMFPFKTIDQLLLEKTKFFESVPNQYMMRGVELEPIALSEFEQRTGLLMFPCVGEHENGWLAGSFDGMTIEQDAIVEIKCAGKKDHMTALNGEIPEKYYPQCQHLIELSGLDMCFYYSKSLYANLKPALIQVKRDNEFIEKMLEKEKEFWDRLQNLNAEKENDHNKCFASCDKTIF